MLCREPVIDGTRHQGTGMTATGKEATPLKSLLVQNTGARAQDEALGGQGFWSCGLSRSLWKRGWEAGFPQGGAMPAPFVCDSTLPQETMAVSCMTLSKPLSSLESIGSHWLN